MHIVAFPRTFHADFLGVIMTVTGMEAEDCIDVLRFSRIAVSEAMLSDILTASTKLGLRHLVRVDPPVGAYDFTNLDHRGDDGWGDVTFRTVNRTVHARLLAKALGCTLKSACEALDYEAFRLTSHQAELLAEALNEAGFAGEIGRILVNPGIYEVLHLDTFCTARVAA